jgi:hypothetical protein
VSRAMAVRLMPSALHHSSSCPAHSYRDGFCVLFEATSFSCISERRATVGQCFDCPHLNTKRTVFYRRPTLVTARIILLFRHLSSKSNFTSSTPSPTAPGALKTFPFSLSRQGISGFELSTDGKFYFCIQICRGTRWQFFEALRYKPEGRGFDTRWCHWNLSLT